MSKRGPRDGSATSPLGKGESRGISNFTFLKADWAFLFDDARESESNALTRPRTSAFYARRALELAIKWVYANDGSVRKPYNDNLGALIHERSFTEVLPASLFNQIRLIHKVGNQAVHSDSKLRPHDGLMLTQALHRLLTWMVRIYAPAGRARIEIASFDESLLRPPETKPAQPDQSSAVLKRIEAELAAKDTATAKAETALARTLADMKQMQSEMAELRGNNAQLISEAELTQITCIPDANEAETRKLFIDVLLREAGWDITAENVIEYSVTGMPNDKSEDGKGTGFADYVLWGANGLPLAVVEAKRTRVKPTKGKQQAKLYADCLEKMTGQRPVIYYTNGFDSWLWDDAIYPPRAVQGFATRDQLQLMVNRRESRKPLFEAGVNKQIAGRYYQEEALRRMGERFEGERHRQALFVMATGSGKTRTAIAAVDMLMKQNWVKRVLFLADRKALVRQAKREFTAHLPHVSGVNLVIEKEADKTRIVFSTYPTMMNLIDDEKSDGGKRFGCNHFDLIIIDEAHRSVYKKFGAIFSYFDALLLGLTATPKAEVDKNTYHLFNLEDNVPTYAYELDQAVADGYLVPPKAFPVPLKFQREGIKYDALSEDEKEQWESEAGFFDDETGEMRTEVDASEMNRWLFNEDTVEKVLATLMKFGQQVEGGDRLGKTILFAKNQAHAEFIVEIFDRNYPKYAGSFCRVISHNVKYAHTLIDEFCVKDGAPHIAVSVDMMDTGIDVPEVVNLVFFKLVRSKTKFWQMIGRGTRLCPDLFGPGLNKKNFYIFDFCQNLEFFEEHPDGVESGAQESVSQTVFKRRIELAVLIQGMDEKPETVLALQSSILDQLCERVARVNQENVLVRPHRREVLRWRDRQRWNNLSFGDQLEIIEHLSGLPYLDDDDEFARRFDLLLLNLQIAFVTKAYTFDSNRKKIRKLASSLEQKQSIPSVAKQMALIQALNSADWWERVDLLALEDVRERLRELIRFIDKENRDVVYSDFEDEVQEPSGDGADIVKPAPDLANYRLKVESFIREHQDHITIKRLRRNEPVTSTDIKGFERILFGEDGAGSKDGYSETFGDAMPLTVLIRKVVGLDRNAAKEAFSGFQASQLFNANQIHFIDQVIDHLVINGVMEPTRLFEQPFTAQNHEGVIGVFHEDAKQVISIVEQINANAGLLYEHRFHAPARNS